MAVSNEAPTVSEPRFRAGLDRLRASYANHDDLVWELERFVRTAPDDQIVRINLIQYAADHGRDEAQVIDLFLHARKAGLLTMEWHYVCRGCGMIIASFHTLNAANEHSFCKTCLKNRDTDLSDFVEIGFTVSKAVRKSRFHDPETLSAKEFFIDYNISAGALARDGTRARDFYWRHKVFCTYVEPDETRTFEINLEPGFFVFHYGPELVVTTSSDIRVERIDITHRDGRLAEPMQKVAPGSMTYNLTNAGPARIIAIAFSIPEAERAAYKETPPGFRLGGFLSGSRLLATQTFRDLFPSETVMSAGGLAHGAAVYRYQGLHRALRSHRRHEGVQRGAPTFRRIARCHCGEPWRAGWRAFTSRWTPFVLHWTCSRRSGASNDSAGEELIMLKIGAHVGPCLAVTLNERLDYFGQTVNLAARVQGLAAENEIYLSDEMYDLTGAADLLAAMQSDAQIIHVKGIEREIAVHALRTRHQGQL